ncbi:MYC binding protein highwire isoform X2 [Leptinotarsa decemlineata]|uniref:MYC binding protein highwire isoform X2 n=1 Tax=Leptinotarsa decemlineata TaxID=7539 RepID=UPI003D306BDB
MLPDPDDFSTIFHEAYKVFPENSKKRLEWKRLKKKSSKLRCKQKNKSELPCENDPQGAPEIELPGNASAFAVFASVRLAVLDRWMRQASQAYLHSSCSAPIQDQSEIESDTEDNSQSTYLTPVIVSKVVGLGLRSVFELIKESRITHPMLCTKALNALLNVLQGQMPEALKFEPPEVIDSLFDLLLDLATLHGPESSVLNDGSHFTAVACACLLSLVVVRGDTGKYLAAAAALLMCPRALSLQNIQMPAVLSSLQKSLHGILLGKIIRPAWITHGVPIKSKIDYFSVKLPNELHKQQMKMKSLACDGQYLYLFTSRGLLKIGSGYGGTIKGHVVAWKPEFYPNDNGSLVFCDGNLYLKLCGRRGCEFLVVERSNLLISASVPLHNRDSSATVVFSDGDYLGVISPAKDDGFVVRMLNQNTSPASLVSELPLKLARKCVDVFGLSSFDEEIGTYTVNTGSEEEIASICTGKEFGLIRTVTGKILYCGKSSALGIKQAGVRTGKWSDLVLTKTPKVSQMSIGHDGLHAVLITEDGSVIFIGTARRGEDGDQNKVRRQPKPVKPKKMIKVDGQCMVYVACNSGTTALINKEGELIMFGKDTTHADPVTGVVGSLKGEFITQVSLGKAHAVALTNKGQVYTFGINNKFQCGREFAASKEENSTNIVAMDTCGVQEEQDLLDEIQTENQKDRDNIPGVSDPNMGEQHNICPPGMHSWHDDMCMICTVCRECTGYSISCLSSVSAERNPGQECGCGEGDSGCAICGCCRICAREVVDNSELADLAGMMRLDLIFREKSIPPRQRMKLQEQLQSRLEERKNKSKKSVQGSSKQMLKSKSSRPVTNTSALHRINNSVRQSNVLATVKEQQGSDVERDAARLTCLPPAKLSLPTENPVIQIACGLHHSLLLLQNGQVYTFGSNLYGQLGCGDILTKNGIQLVRLPCSAVHVAAGSNHSVVLTSKGEVYTFGNAQKGQLGRSPNSSQDATQPGNSSSSRYSNPRTPWYSIPGLIPNIGPRHGRRATWVGASGDQTFLKLDESLINSISISKSTVTANKHSIVLLPNEEETAKNFKCLVINKRDGNCNSFKSDDQVDFSNKIVCMDPIYNVLWSYDSNCNEFSCYNVIASELQLKNSFRILDNHIPGDITSYDPETPDVSFQLASILSPELALPVTTNCFVTRFQAAINLLCCLDILSIAHQMQISTINDIIDDRQLMSGKQYSKEDFQAVNRFESHGGGWGYSGHSIEAIRFMADSDILLGGFGLFGGRGEYTAKLKLLDIGPEGGEQEIDGELLAETEEIPYECGPRQKFPILFDEPVPLQAHRWFVAWCRISGPSSDCGSSGQTMVTTEDQVLFYFKSSKKSNNGTDVNAGQIPQLLYKIITPENQSPPRQTDIVEPIHILSKGFSRTVTKECFQSLLSLLQWSWNTFKWGVVEGQSLKNMYTTLELERLVYISRASLRLICTYTNEIYPKQINRKVSLENVQLAECIGDVRTLLKQILSDNIPIVLQNKKPTKINMLCINMMNNVLDECHHTFVLCFHAFYPTAYLKWTCLCDLLAESNKDNGQNIYNSSQRLLSAVLCALCAPSVRLRSTFPLIGHSVSSESSLHRGLSPSDNTGLPMMSVSDSHHYPILVEQMSYKTQMESSCSGISWQWNEVLECLINLACDPIMRSLQKSNTSCSLELTKYCCHLLARVLAELVHQCSSAEEDLQGTCGRTLHMTPSRFTRTNQSRTWNTGNGSPDAICFQVDHPGISVVGAGIYGGIGHYEYELELLEDTSTMNGPDGQTHAHRWNSLEVTRGSFGPEDFPPDIIEIKFDRAVPIKENIKYAIRLRNHGGRTNNGDGGLSSVKGSDNTIFTFSTCSLSFNGSTLARGQIPVILYYSNPLEYGRAATTKLEQQARNTALSMTSSISQKASNLMVLAREKADEVPAAEILSKSCIVTTLLPLVLAHISPLATSDSKSAVHILNLIQELLPHVAALNLMGTSGCLKNKLSASLNMSSTHEPIDYKADTTSHHYTLVESDHPYKPSTVTNYRVLFPESVKWMSLDFDPACSTVQPEDSLQLFVPAMNYKSEKKSGGCSEDNDTPPMPYWPVLHRFSGSLTWPTNSIILPGNEVIFSLETASDYLKDDRISAYGFKCLVLGYEWPPEGTTSLNIELKHLESELSFLGGMCAASLLKKDILLPVIGDEADIDMEMAENIASDIFSRHSPLLSKGLALSSPPTVHQALDGMLPYSAHSNERLFLRDFVNCAAGSSGGRLAQWLQPGSRADPSKSQVLYAREDLRCGWPAIITVLTRDQYGDMVHVPNMKIDVKAVPFDKKDIGDTGRKMRRVSQPDLLTFGGLPPPPLHHPYEPTVKEKMCFHSITVMKPFQNYSFEELRYSSPPVKRSGENMLVRSNSDGSYSATWTPASIGCYSIMVNIDGYDMEEIFKVEVKEPPQGMTPPNQNIAKKSEHQPSKLRKFVAKNSAGLRVRAHPSLQSEQIGVVHVNGTIAFIDEIHNDDGVWLRLSADTIKQYCSISVIEAWCLQYNQHLGKTLLLPVEEPKTILDQVINDTIMRKLPEIQERNKSSTSSINYQVIKCGASGHNVRSRPSFKAPPVGMLVLGNRIGVTEYTVNSDGCWVMLDTATKDKYCFNSDSEAWSLAIGHNNVLYLGNVNESDACPKLSSDAEASRKQKRGFNFSLKTNEANFSFSAQNTADKEEVLSTNPFIFGESAQPELVRTPKKEKKEGKLSSLPKWFKGEDTKNESSDHSSIKGPSESAANGNGITPPDTPRRSLSPRCPNLSPKIMSRSSSPVGVPYRTGVQQDSTSSSAQVFGSPKSMAVSPLVCGTGFESSAARRGSNQSDTSALVSSLTRDTSQSPSQATQPRETSPCPSSSSFHTRSDCSPLHRQYSKDSTDSEQSSKKLTQTGTQTSPENSNNVPIKTNFSIGAMGKEEKVSPKMARKDRNIAKIRPKRAISPANLQQLPASTKISYGSETVKEAMSPSVAESLRAVFAAFLWHEGIVHDAMACASFLKFHPTLPKQGAPVVTRHQEPLLDKRHRELSKEEKARQRHSVEVSNAGTYLHIQPSTLESLTRSAANASANRNRRKMNEGVIKEEGEKFCSTDSYGYQTISVLPPALKSLVYLWEELTANCLQAVSQQMTANSPVHAKTKKSDKNDSREKNTHLERESRKCRKKKNPPRNYLENLGSLPNCLQSSGVDTLCELCGDNFPHPVTYHMHQSHPGCGQHAGGKGYNSGGSYCLGWAGNCGDGGTPGSSWYLLCENCREKYLKLSKGGKPSNIRHKTAVSRRLATVNTLSSPSAGLEPHVIMKNNAMFLLDLASSAEPTISHQRTSSASIMPSVSENISPPDCISPFGPPPSFQCLQSLGANQAIDEPTFYNEILRKRDFPENFRPGTSSSGQRPLSEVSISDDSDSSKGLRFHRSVSMGTNGIPWSKSGYDGRIIMMRKRNNSSCEIASEGGSSLLCNPSNALQKLIPKRDNPSSVIVHVHDTSNDDNNEGLALLQRPVLQFLLQQHDLESLQLSMKQALRKAMCRVYAMQALNWLLRSVTQPICLHDLLWWFVTSLTPIEMENEPEEDNRLPKRDDELDLNVCEHPLSDITIAGEAVHPLPSTFHSLLQTIADLMVLLPMGSALQQIAIRCWGIRFTSSDHSFLHRSQVFSNISKILSRSEEMEDFTVSMHESALNQITATVECLKDLTSTLEIKASSRQAMVGSLTDNSTETFWESGDEDRNKTKSVTMICPQGHHPVLICIHIDNCRDLGIQPQRLSDLNSKDQITRCV